MLSRKRDYRIAAVFAQVGCAFCGVVLLRLVGAQRPTGSQLAPLSVVYACLLVSYRPLATRSLNAREALEAAPRGDTPSDYGLATVSYTHLTLPTKA